MYHEWHMLRQALVNTQDSWRLPDIYSDGQRTACALGKKCRCAENVDLSF